LIVFALAGDSTIRRFFAIGILGARAVVRWASREWSAGDGGLYGRGRFSF
jgi:hypothetical protein